MDIKQRTFWCLLVVVVVVIILKIIIFLWFYCSLSFLISLFFWGFRRVSFVGYCEHVLGINNYDGEFERLSGLI